MLIFRLLCVFYKSSCQTFKIFLKSNFKFGQIKSKSASCILIFRLLRVSYESSRPQVFFNMFEELSDNLTQRFDDKFRMYKNGKLAWNDLK